MYPVYVTMYIYRNSRWELDLESTMLPLLERCESKTRLESSNLLLLIQT